MNKFSRLLSIAVIIFTIFVFSFQLYRHIDDPIRGDEAAWIFSTVYLKHYVNGKWHHHDWDELDAIDHPPVAKYYFGIAAKLAGFEWDDLNDKRWWHEQSADEYGSGAFQLELERRVPGRVLIACRIAAVVSALAACIGLFVLGAWLVNPVVGALAVLAFTLSRMTLYYVPIVEPDYLLMAFCFWQAAFLVRWIKSSGWGSAIICGVLLGFVIDTKLSGLIQVPVTFAGALFAIFLSRQRTRGALQALAVLVAAVGFTLILNPSFDAPFATLSQMVEHRRIQLAGVTLYSGMEFIPPLFPMIKGFQHLFTDFGLLVDSAWFPLGLILATAGGVEILSHLTMRGRWLSDGAMWTILVMVKLWCSQAIWAFSRTLRLRYLLPIQPFISLFIALGLVYIWKTMIEARRLGWPECRVKMRVPIMGAVLFLVLWLGPATMNVDGEIVSAMNCPEVQKERLEFLLRRHPEAVAPRLNLTEFYIRDGDHVNAARVLGPVMFLERDNKILRALYEVVSEQASRDERGSR